MARETKIEKTARVDLDNKRADRIPAGISVMSSLFGPVTLGKNLGPVAPDPSDPGNSSGGWDIYDVEHSGVHHRWTSVSVLAMFAKAANV